MLLTEISLCILLYWQNSEEDGVVFPAACCRQRGWPPLQQLATAAVVRLCGAVHTCGAESSSAFSPSLSLSLTLPLYISLCCPPLKVDEFSITYLYICWIYFISLYKFPVMLQRIILPFAELNVRDLNYVIICVSAHNEYCQQRDSTYLCCMDFIIRDENISDMKNISL